MGEHKEHDVKLNTGNTGEIGVNTRKTNDRRD